MALGRGLDALLGDSSLQAQTGGSVSLPIAQVEPGLNQPRKHFEEEALADLARSSIDASLASASRKAAWKADIDAWLAAPAA